MGHGEGAQPEASIALQHLLKMHIAFYAPRWPVAQATNGIVTYVHQMRSGLLSLGHRVTILSTYAEPAEGVVPIPALRTDGLRRRWARLRGRDPITAHGVEIAEALRALHRRDPVDLIEMEESFAWCSDVARVGVPTVVKLHGPAFLTFVEEERRLPHAARRIVEEGRALNAVRYVTAPSRSTLDATVRRYGLRSTVAQLPNPIDVDRLPTWSADRAQPWTVLFVGRFDKLKGADRVLQAFKSVLQRQPQARLIFVGPDLGLSDSAGALTKFEPYVQASFTPEERQRIDYRGPLPVDQVTALRLQCGVTVVASLWESACYTAIEAMAQGCPLVAMECDGINEVVKHGTTGLLARSVPEFAEGMLQCLGDLALASRVGAAARLQIRGTHSLQVAVQAAAGFYSSRVIGRP